MSGNQPPPPNSAPPKGVVPGPPPIKQSTTQKVSSKRDNKKKRDKSIENKEMEEKENIKRKESQIANKKYEEAYNMQKYDQLFYEAIHGQKLNHPIQFGSTSYDIALIRHLSYTFWTNIKQLTTRDIVQKLTNLVMAPINQHDDRISNAIQCGVDGRQVQKLVNKLVEKTGVDVLALEQLIKNKSTIQIPKSINDLDNKELEEIYGINRETLLKIKEKRVKQLKDFKKLKKKTLLKIYHIKNGSVEDINQGKNNDDEKEDIDDDEDDYDTLISADNNKQKITQGQINSNDDDNYYGDIN
eukprot:423042_1